MWNIFAKIFAMIWKTWYFHVKLFTLDFCEIFTNPIFLRQENFDYSIPTDRYVMWYGAITVLPPVCCRRRRHRHHHHRHRSRYSHCCYCFSLSVSFEKVLDSMQLLKAWPVC